MEQRLQRRISVIVHHDTDNQSPFKSPFKVQAEVPVEDRGQKQTGIFGGPR